MMLNCTAEHKDVRYCVTKDTCGKNVAAIQCYSEPNRQKLQLLLLLVTLLHSRRDESAEVKGLSASVL